MLDVNHLRDPVDTVRDQEASAADRDQRLVTRVGLHPVHAFRDHRVDARDRSRHELGRQRGDPPLVAQVDETGGHGDVGGGELAPAEHEALLDQPIADASGADR